MIMKHLYSATESEDTEALYLPHREVIADCLQILLLDTMSYVCFIAAFRDSRFI